MLASAEKILTFMHVAATTRRLFGFCGGAVRQNISITEDAYVPLGSEKEREVRATTKKAKKRRVGPKPKVGLSYASKDKMKGEGQTLNGPNGRTVLRNRRHKCDSEYHLAHGFGLP